MDPAARAPDSTLGRLLQELSWVGSNIRAYRNGGLGFENVLTAEVLTVLDYLPRRAFLGAVIAGAVGAAEARRTVLEEIEQAELTLLPEELTLTRSDSKTVVVQPDGTLVSPSSYVLIEAKRIRRSSFQPEQLAREYAGAMQEAQGRTPLLLLILGGPPPVSVAGAGRLSIEDAVKRHFGEVLHARPDATDARRPAQRRRLDYVPSVRGHRPRVAGKRLLWQCSGCRYQVSLTAGTVLHGTRTPLHLCFWAAYLMATAAFGILALQLQRQLGISRYETAWMMLLKLRRAMVNPERQPLTGQVEVDE